MRTKLRMFGIFGTLLLTAFAGGAIVTAQPAGSVDRHRAVSGWLIQDMAEEDGGRLIRMTRSSGAYRLEFHVAFWRGNDARIQRVSVARAGCRSEEAIDPILIVHVSEIRSLLTGGLAACGASQADKRAALRGVEPAYALVRKWDWDAAVATAAEATAIANYGADDGMSTDESCDATANASKDQDLTEMNDVQAGVAC